MVSVQQVGQEGLQENQGRDDAAQTSFARRESGGTPQPRLGRMGKVLQVRVSVAAVRESERVRAATPVQVPQQEEPAAVSAGIRRNLLRRIPETRAYSPHKKEIPMTSVSHGKPYAGNPHARFEEGASAPANPRRNALLHTWKKVLTGFIMIFFIILSIFCFLLFFPLFDYEDEILFTVMSPDAMYCATAFRRNAGATTDYSTCVTIGQAPGEKISEKGLVFVVSGCHKLSLEWKDKYLLIINTDAPPDKIFRKINQLGQIKILYMNSVCFSYLRSNNEFQVGRQT